VSFTESKFTKCLWLNEEDETLQEWDQDTLVRRH
jgi:hypothetical protein